MVMLSTIALTGYLYVDHPEGLLPAAGHRARSSASPRPRRTFRFPRCPSASRRWSTSLLQDPAIAVGRRAISARAARPRPLNQGRIFIIAEAESRNARPAPTPSSTGCKPKLAHIQGIILYMQAAQDITIGARLSKTQYQFTLTDADPNELTHWATDLPGKAFASIRRRHRRRQRPGQCRPDAGRHGRSRGRLELRHPARRRSTTRSTTPSASASSRPCSPR